MNDELMPAAARVLVNHSLWRYISSFQRGIPLVLYEFWVLHDPGLAQRPRGLMSRSTKIKHLVALIIKHGSLHQLELLATACKSRGDATVRFTEDFHEAIRLAIQANRADMVDWTIYHHAPSALLRAQDLWTDAVHSYDNSDTSVLDILQIHTPIPTEQLAILTETTRDLRLIQWLGIHHPKAVPKKIMATAIADGNLELVQHLLDWHSTKEYDPQTNGDAAYYQQRQLEIALRRFQKRPNYVSSEFLERLIWEGSRVTMGILRKVGSCHAQAHAVAVRSIAHGRADVLKRIFDEDLLPNATVFSIDEPASKGQLDIVWFLTESTRSIATTDAMDNAAKHGKLNVVKYLHANRSEGCTTKAMDSAAEGGYLACVKFLHEKRTEGCTTQAMDGAATNGHLEIVEFLHANRREGSTTQAMDEAAERGAFRVVKFLHANRHEGCTARAMDLAAGHGALHIVKYLHEKRSEGCTTDAMDAAAGSGHLHIVRYLYANRSEGCTVEAMKTAARGGYLEIVRFLYEYFKSRFDSTMLHDLLVHGAFDLWMELRRKNPEACDADAGLESALLDAGERMELATIQFIVHGLGREDLAHLAVDGAAKSKTHQYAQWPRAVMAITGPQSCRLSAVRNAMICSSPGRLSTELQYLIKACCEPGAYAFAISTAKASIGSISLVEMLEEWDLEEELALSPMHPLLLEPTCPGWAIRLALGDVNRFTDPFHRCEWPVPWAIQAVYRGDQILLGILLKLQLDAVEYKFHGAHAAAIRTGNLRLLQWLLSNVPLPVELTLLDEALYYHQFEITEWLAEHCVDCRRELDWDSKVNAPWFGECGLDTRLLNWIERRPCVQRVVDFGSLASYAVTMGDFSLLMELYGSHPEQVIARTDLMVRALKNEDENQDIIEFLDEIQYPFE